MKLVLLAGLLCRNSSSRYSTVGAAFLTAAGGKYYYEVELLEAQGTLYVGFAGTNFGPQCSYVGNDSASWSFYQNISTGYGSAQHGCVHG